MPIFYMGARIFPENWESKKKIARNEALRSLHAMLSPAGGANLGGARASS